MLFFGKKSVAETTIKVGYKGEKAKEGLKGLKNTIKTVMSAYAIKQIAGYTYQLAKMGATADLVGKSFDKFARDRGSTFDDMMNKLRTATNGLLTDMELQQQAMQAMIGGVDFDDVVTSMEYVSKFALTTGTDVASKMRTVMTGIARGSAAFLDDVGIQVMGSKNVVKDAMDQMKAKMSQFTVSEDDAIVKATQLNVSLKNLAITIGSLLTPTLGKVTSMLSSVMNSFSMTFGNKKLLLQYHQNSIKNLDILIKKKKEYEMNRVSGYRDPYLESLASVEQLEKNRLRLLKQINKITENPKQKNLNSIQKEIDKYTTIIEKTKDVVSKERTHNEAIKRRNILLEEQKILVKEIRKEIAYSSFSSSKGRKEQEKRDLFKATIDKPEKSKKEKISSDDEESKKEAQEMLDIMEINESKKKKQKEHYAYIEGIKRIHDQVTLSQNEYAKQEIINNVNDEYAVLIEKYQSNNEVLKDIDILKKREIEDRQREHAKTMTGIDEEEAMTKIDIAKNMYSQLATTMNTFQSFSDAITNQKISNLEKENLTREEFAKRRESLIEKGKEKAKELARFQQAMAVFQAIINTYTAGMQTYAQAPIFTKTIAMALTIAQGMLTVGKIQAQHFSQGSGTIGETQSYRSSDSIHAMIGKGERVISAPDNARNKEVLDAIANNTMSTNLSLKRFGTSSSGSVVNNFYSLTDEQLQRATNNNNRKNIIGEQI